MNTPTKSNECNGIKRPVAVTLVAVILFGYSLASIVSDVVSFGGLRTERMFFPILNIVAAFGLLKLQSGWRTYVLVIFGLSLLFLLPFGAWAVFNSERIVIFFPEIRIEDRPHSILSPITVLGVILAYALSSVWTVWVLMRRDVRHLFGRRRSSVERFN